MRHSDYNRRFGREVDQRRALMIGLAEAIIKNGRIKTTEAKAKELRPYVEKLVTHAKAGSLAGTRILTSRLATKGAVTKLTKEIAPKYKERVGGYMRVIKMPARKSDGAKMAILEFV
ncbi:MAG TPA: 50S ribosomal protein L17 [Candidatus Paceibacterota bacterium]